MAPLRGGACRLVFPVFQAILQAMTLGSHITLFDPTVLETEYFLRLRSAHEKHWHDGVRSFPVIVEKLQSIFAYNQDHGRSFAARLKDQQHDLRSCQGTVSEVIVYAHYVPLVKQGHIKALHINRDECDLQIERDGKPDSFLEVLCLMPNWEAQKNVSGVYDYRAHTQTASSSVRQRLLSKMKQQRQMTKARENWAVVELNDLFIAGDFTVLSSLSDGYKVIIDLKTSQLVGSGYDWGGSIFDDPATQNLHGIVYFDLGDYERRRYVLNPRIWGENADRVPFVP